MTADDFFTGGVSAACGGTTTIVPVCRAAPGAVAARRRGRLPRRAAEGRAFVDYGFHLIVSDPNAAVLREDLPDLVAMAARR